MSILIKNVILDGVKKDVYIEQGLIKKIGSSLNFKAKEKIDACSSKAIIPSLINSHTHAAMSIFRGYADDLFLDKWLNDKIWPLEEKLNQDDIYWGTKLACLEMIKTGTSFFNDMYMFPGTASQAVKEMGMRAMIGLVVVGFDSKEINRLEERYLRFKKQEDELVKFSVSPHSIYAVSRENLINAGKFALSKKMILHTHLSETEKEVKDCLKKYKTTPTQLLDKLGLLSPRTVLAHGVHLSLKEIKILSQRKVSLSHNPTSNLKLSVNGIFPYLSMVKNKVNVMLGTDGCASNNNLDMFQEMKTASLIQKYRENNPTVAPAKEIFQAASRNGFKFFNLNGGEIKEGKIADFLLINLNEASLVPGHCLVSDLVYSASGEVVSDMICNGKIVMRDRKVKQEQEIIKQARKRWILKK